MTRPTAIKAPGLLYVAISRVRTLASLTLNNIPVKHMQLTKRNDVLLHRLEEEIRLAGLAHRTFAVCSDMLDTAEASNVLNFLATERGQLAARLAAVSALPTGRR